MNKQIEMSSSSILRASALSFPFQTQSPFLFAVYHLDNYPSGKPDLSVDAPLYSHNIGADFGHPDGWSMYHGDSVPGFPQHPHKGFETITLVRRGTVDHADSLGCKGRFSNGDTQWMTAGGGVAHCEMFPMLNQKGGNPLDLFQIWLNLPKKSKLVDAYFSMHWSENAVRMKNDGITVQTVAGQMKGEKAPESPPPDSWASDPKNHVAVWAITVEKGKQWTLPSVEEKDSAVEVNRSLFFFKGEACQIDGKTFTKHANLHMNARKDAVIKNTGSDTVELLMLQGAPIDEPVVQRGPFVMNTSNEIMQAMMEYRSGKWGRWPWKSDGPTHGRMGRFALYSDGKCVDPKGNSVKIE